MKDEIVKKRRKSHEQGTIRRFRPEPLIARPTNPHDTCNWDGLVVQLMGLSHRTPYNMAMRRLNALNLAAAALRHAGETSVSDQVTTLAAAVEVPPME